MSLWFAAILGLVQGLTEFIPVSSNAHLRIVGALLSPKDPGAAFTAVLQLGSVAAVITYFAKDLYAMLGHLTRPATPDGRLAWQIAAATVPIVVIGLLFKKHVEEDTRSLYLICGTLISVGVLMFFIDRWAEQSGGTKPIANLTWTDVMIIGGAQCFALLPGVSRSGSTICMALLLGLTRSDAARFSFLLSIPAVAGAGILESRVVFKSFALGPIAVGVGVAAVTSYAAIAWLMRFLGTHQLAGFAIYRVIAGLALLAALVGGLLDPLVGAS
jgi:undecaprenyl-diphosphatase